MAAHNDCALFPRSQPRLTATQRLKDAKTRAVSAELSAAHTRSRTRSCTHSLTHAPVAHSVRAAALCSVLCALSSLLQSSDVVLLCAHSVHPRPCCCCSVVACSVVRVCCCCCCCCGSSHSRRAVRGSPATHQLAALGGGQDRAAVWTGHAERGGHCSAGLARGESSGGCSCDSRCPETREPSGRQLIGSLRTAALSLCHSRARLVPVPQDQGCVREGLRVCQGERRRWTRVHGELLLFPVEGGLLQLQGARRWLSGDTVEEVKCCCDVVPQAPLHRPVATVTVPRSPSSASQSQSFSCSCCLR